jgi:orotidine-5'-phosphate decarboxylase
MIDAARQRRGGIFVLVRTSNPGAADLQDRRLEGAGTVSDSIARTVTELGAAGVGSAGLADVGAVVGATVPSRLEELRGQMPQAIVLLAGVGAQGGRVEDLAAAFAPHRAAGLVSSSRGLVGAHEQAGGDPADAARAEAARLRERAWAVSAG